MAAIIGLLSIIPIYITFFAVRENPDYQDLPAPPIRQSFRIAAGNKAFLIAAGIYLLTWIPIDLIQFVLVFLLRDYFGLDAGGVDIVFALLFGVAVLALPLWVWLSGRWNKNRAYQVGIAFLAVVLVVLSFAPPGQPRLIVILAILAGIGLSAAHAIPLAMLPDTIEWDELRTANRQEAAYYSVVTLIQKLVGAVTIALTGVDPGGDRLRRADDQCECRAAAGSHRRHSLFGRALLPAAVLHRPESCCAPSIR